MITAKNYAAQAQKGLYEYSSALKNAGMKNDALRVKSWADLISTAVHFAIPDSGILLGNKAKSLHGHELRLPFENITIERYVTNKTELNINDQKARLKKQVILASFLKSSDIIKFYGKELPFINSSEYCIAVSSAYIIIESWQPCLLMQFIPCNNWEDIENLPTIIERKSEESIGFSAWIVPWLNETLNHLFLSSKIDYKDYLDTFMQDISDDSAMLLEFLEALSCKNVEATTYCQASEKNAKRIAQGKLPIFETKVLTIKPGNVSTNSGKNSGGHHASPRQHLRRGHIRRLETGNIWVNSCVVGDSNKGFIEKTYKVSL